MALYGARKYKNTIEKIKIRKWFVWFNLKQVVKFARVR